MPYSLDGVATRRRLLNEIASLREFFEEGSADSAMRGALLEDTVADSLPNNTDADVFTVSGGRVVIFGYWMEITTAIQNQATNIKLRWKPSGGSYGDLSAVVDCNAAAVGSCICLVSAVIATAAGLLVGHATTGFTSAANGLSFPAGTFGFHSATNSTGAVKGRLLWAPLDVGATVAVA